MVMIGLKPPLGVISDGTAPASTNTGVVTAGDVVTTGGGAVTSGLKPRLGVKPDGTAPASTTGPANVVPATGGTIMIGLRPPPNARFDGTAPALTGESAKVSPVIDGSDDEKQAPDVAPDDAPPLASKAGSGPPKSKPGVALQLGVLPAKAPGMTAAAPSGIAVALVVGRIAGPIAPSGAAAVGPAGDPITPAGETVLIAGIPMAPGVLPKGGLWARLAPQLMKRAIAVVKSKRMAFPLS